MTSGNRICYLHVGTGKTGSSAIQYALTQKHRELLKAGLLYPDASRNFRAVLAGKPTSGNATTIVALLHEGNTAAAMNIIKGYSRRGEHLVLSCEGFSNLSPAALAELASGLADLGYVPKCLVLFRPQFERVTSSYLQQVKADRPTTRVPLEQYADQMIALRVRRFDWYQRAKKLESAFGKNNLTVLWYPALRRRGLDGVPAAVFEWLGVPSLYSPGETPRSLLVNPTPSREALVVLKETNARGLGGKDFADRFLTTALERGVSGTKVLLSKAVTERIHNATIETNRRLFQEYCPDLDPEKELQPPDEDGALQAPLDEKAVIALRGIAVEVLGRRRRARPLDIARAGNALGTKPSTSVRPNCVIHVGMHKTGSTSIQKSLIGFEDDRFVYADLGNYGNHSVPIYSLFSHRPEQHHIHRSAGRNAAEAKRYVADVRNKLKRELARAGSRTLIISGEDISVLRPGDLANLHEYFKERVNELRIVAYVRAPAALMASRFQQLVKGGTIAALDFDRIYRSYEGLLAKFDDVFGRDKVELWKFDPAAFPDGDVVQDFCTRLGIDLPRTRIVRMNESISRQAVSLLYCYAKSARGPESKIRAPEAIRLGEMIEGEKFRFSPQLVQSVLRQQEADIAWMEQRLGTSLQENLGSENPGDIREESDLLRPDPDAVSRLLKILGRRAPEGVKGETPEEVAQLVAAWRKTLSRRDLRWENRPDIKRWLLQGGGRRKRTPRRSFHLGIMALLARLGFRSARGHRRQAKLRSAAKQPAGKTQSPYTDLPKAKFWRTGVAEADVQHGVDLYSKKFEITPTMRIATAGSCFAQHIGRRLRERGFNVLDVEPPPPELSAESAMRYNYGIYSARYGNIYLTRQLLQLAQEAFGKFKPADVVWRKGERYYDALRPGVEPDGCDSPDEVLALREAHLAAVRNLFSQMKLFVFTFGLTESWIHRESQTVYPSAPGTIAGSFDPEIYAFKNFTFEETANDFVAFRNLIRAVNPAVRFLLTVSPVPLTATASEDHVLPATMYSKAVLRAVAGQMSKDFSDVAYFPSFEIVASPWAKSSFFQPNLRSVSAEGVDAVMRVFFAAHPQAAAAAEPRPDSRHKAKQPRPTGDADPGEVCEEAMLEAFNR